MALHVHIPTRLRVDPRALLERQDGIEEALSEAVLRALRRSRDVVRAESAGSLEVTCHRPEFTWMGVGLGSVSTALRSTVEERVTRALLEATHTAAIADLTCTAGDAIESSIDVEEKVDADRYSRALGLYAVPSYGDKGKKAPVKVVSFDDEPEALSVDFEAATEWERLEYDDVFERAIKREFEQTGRSFPETGLIGVIYKDAYGTMRVDIQRFPSTEGRETGDLFLDVPIFDLKDRTLRMKNGKPEPRESSVQLSPGASYRLKFLAGAGTDELNIKALGNFYGNIFAAKIDEATRKDSRKVNLTEEERSRLVAAQLNSVIRKMASQVPEDARCFLELSVNGKGFLMASEYTTLSGLDIELIPMATPRRRRKTAGKAKFVGVAGGGAGARGAGQERGAGRAAGQGGAGAGQEGDGSAGEGKAARGGFIYTEEAEGTAGMSFPAFSGGKVLQLVCQPFLGEPPVEEMGSDGAGLRALIDEIAYGLQIPTCRFAAQFCLNAAAALGGRAIALGSVSVHDEAATRPVEVGKGNVGSVQFTPVASASIQYMRHFARVTAQITDLMNLLGRLYKKPQHFARIKNDYIDVPAAWQRRFHIELTDVMKSSVASIFVVTCRILLLQLLRASKAGIAARLSPQSFETQVMLFELMVNSQLSQVGYFMGLRDKLKAHELKEALGLENRPTAWLDSTKALTAVLAAAKPHEPLPTGPPDEVVKVGGQYLIRDNRNKLWAMSDLETAIAFARGTAESVDPIIKQITEVPEVLERVKNNPDGARRELRKILEEMETNNKEMLEKVNDSAKYAFRASKIQEDLPTATVKDTSYPLQGIHMQVHEQIGEFFRGSPFYAIGIDSLFSATLGEAEITSFFVYTGLTVLSILCPPLAFVVGADLALYEYGKALERERLYGSMIDPEVVLTRAEVEADLFAAKLGLALQFIPEVGSILKGGAKVVLKQGVAGATRTLARSARKALTGDIVESVGKRISRELAEKLEYGFAVAFAKEVVTDQVMDAVISKALEPLMAQIEREAKITGAVGGIEGALEVHRMIEQEKARKRESAAD